jgi:hypothetical protein
LDQIDPELSGGYDAIVSDIDRVTLTFAVHQQRQLLHVIDTRNAFEFGGHI